MTVLIIVFILNNFCIELSRGAYAVLIETAKLFKLIWMLLFQACYDSSHDRTLQFDTGE